MEQALQLAPDTHPQKAFIWFGLGIVLFKPRARGSAVDWEKARKCFENANALGFTWCRILVDYMRMTDMYSAESQSNPEELDRLFLSLEQALQNMTPPPGARFWTESMLASVLAMKSAHTGTDTDHSRAVSAAELLERAAAERYPYYAAANSDSRNRFLNSVLSGDQNDMGHAIAAARQNLAMVSEDDPRRVQHVYFLGGLLCAQFARTTNYPIFLEAWMLLSHVAHSPIGQISDRLHAACMVGRLVGNSFARRAGPTFAINAYNRAINLLPEVAWLGLNIRERYRATAEVSLVGTEAVEYAIQWNRYELAVEWAEQVWLHRRCNTTLTSSRQGLLFGGSSCGYAVRWTSWKVSIPTWPLGSKTYPENSIQLNRCPKSTVITASWR